MSRNRTPLIESLSEPYTMINNNLYLLSYLQLYRRKLMQNDKPDEHEEKVLEKGEGKTLEKEAYG